MYTSPCSEEVTNRYFYTSFFSELLLMEKREIIRLGDLCILRLYLKGLYLKKKCKKES